MYICMYACMYVCIYVCMYVHAFLIMMYVFIYVSQPYAYEINAERLKSKVQEMDQANDRLRMYVCMYIYE